MPIYNTCSICGKKIKTRQQSDPFLDKILRDSTTAVCNECDPLSQWVPIFPKLSGNGIISGWEYIEINTKDGKGLLLRTENKEIYFPPLASKKELILILDSLPDYIKNKIRGHSVLMRLME